MSSGDFSGDERRPRIWPTCCESTHRTKRALRVANRSTPQEHAMIAATAFAVVGLVVVAFLNRIP
jgi:hypothetical protein